MTRRLVLASRNRGKLAELRRILAGLDVELLDAHDVDLPDVDETGVTFAENALVKARAARDASGLASVADDSGLVVDVLGGQPGVRSARYAGGHGDDAANLALVLERMAGRDDRTARFVCVAALAAPDGREWTAEGVLDGTLTHEPRGTGGFGYDPIFLPAGSTRTTAELTPEEKDAISHRGKAFRGLRQAVAVLILLALAGCAGAAGDGAGAVAGSTGSGEILCSEDATVTPPECVPPEPPEGQLVTPEPGTVDPRPIPWERAEPVGDGSRIRVTWTGGVETCYALDRVEVAETPDTVTITVHEGTLPTGEGQPCIEIGVIKATEVELTAPLADLRIVDGAPS